MKKTIILFAIILSAFTINAQSIPEEQKGFLSEIRIFAGSTAPENWAFCQGQLIPISSNDSLYSVIGNTYGGDGITTFALPDLRCRSAVGVGWGPGLGTTTLGQRSSKPYASSWTNGSGSSIGLHYIICVQGVKPK